VGLIRNLEKLQRPPDNLNDFMGQKDIDEQTDIILAKCLDRVIDDLAPYLTKEGTYTTIVTQALGAKPDDSWKFQEEQLSEGEVEPVGWKSQEGQSSRSPDRISDWKSQEGQSEGQPRTIEGWETNLIPSDKLNEDELVFTAPLQTLPPRQGTPIPTNFAEAEAASMLKEIWDLNREFAREDHNDNDDEVVVKMEVDPPLRIKGKGAADAPIDLTSDSESENENNKDHPCHRLPGMGLGMPIGPG